MKNFFVGMAVIVFSPLWVPLLLLLTLGIGVAQIGERVIADYERCNK